ncbi:MAG: hypothetical protein MZV64_11115 [Ignavibacteriales bacterium]|nr:hypothetical protein [Ignavibacteriales bacterium]
MPELPEVETIARSLAPRITGRRIAGIDLLYKPLLRTGGKKGLAALCGRRVLGVRRRGKMLLVDVRGRPHARLPPQDDRPVPVREGGHAARQARPPRRPLRGREERAPVPRRPEIRLPALPRRRARGRLRRARRPRSRAARGRAGGVPGDPARAQRPHQEPPPRPDEDRRHRQHLRRRDALRGPHPSRNVRLFAQDRCRRAPLPRHEEDPGLGRRGRRFDAHGRGLSRCGRQRRRFPVLPQGLRPDRGALPGLRHARRHEARRRPLEPFLPEMPE